jgi:hypothetical protein
MGLIIVGKKKFKFSWIKVTTIAVLSALNKAMSGGGYGPLVASGLIISGRSGKSSIGLTDFAEAPICFLAFTWWMILGANINLNPRLLVPLIIGASIGGILGPLALSKSNDNRKMTLYVGRLALILGVCCTLSLLKP